MKPIYKSLAGIIIGGAIGVGGLVYMAQAIEESKNTPRAKELEALVKEPDVKRYLELSRTADISGPAAYSLGAIISGMVLFTFSAVYGIQKAVQTKELSLEAR